MPKMKKIAEQTSNKRRNRSEGRPNFDKRTEPSVEPKQTAQNQTKLPSDTHPLMHEKQRERKKYNKQTKKEAYLLHTKDSIVQSTTDIISISDIAEYPEHLPWSDEKANCRNSGKSGKLHDKFPPMVHFCPSAEE